MLVLALVDGAIAVTARALTRGAIASILQPAHLLREGNALLNIGFAFAVVGGSALAGLLISESGSRPALLADAASFVAIAIVLGGHARTCPRPTASRSATLERLRSGLAFARRDPRVRLLLGGQSRRADPLHAGHPDRGDLREGEPRDDERRLRRAARLVGRRDRRRQHPLRRGARPLRCGLILLSTAAIGLAYLGMAGAQSLFYACLLSVLGGTGNGIQWVSVMTALQEATPQDYQARVVGLLESALAAMPGVGYLIGGVLTAVGSPRTAYAVAGAGTLLLVVVALVALRGLRLEHPARRSERSSRRRSRRDLHRPTDAREVSLETGER